MKLSNKPENKFPQTEKKEYKTVWVDWKLYEVDEQATLPYGANVGKTLEWVIENDHNYYLWMVKNNIIASWGLIRKRDNNKTIHRDGVKWIMLIEYPGTGIPSPFLND